MRIVRVSTLILLAGIAGSYATAQNKDLSGTWNLNVGKSFMGSDHPSNDYRLTRKVEQKNGALSITDASVHASIVNIPLPDSTTTMEFAADGKEHDVKLPPPFPGMPAMAAKVSAVWQGCTLEIRRLIPGFGGSSKERLFLSDDGSQLIVLVEQHSTFSDSEQRLVFDKQT
jgi:hypothetical protein